jgi:hypothetical protein
MIYNKNDQLFFKNVTNDSNKKNIGNNQIQQKNISKKSNKKT